MIKIKKILSAIIVMAMVCCNITLPVQAAYCCTLSIDSIVQESDKVTVYYSTNSTEDNRVIRIGLSSVEQSEMSSTWNSIERREITIPSGFTSSSIIFDTSILVTGCLYGIDILQDHYCSQSNCQWNTNKLFTAEYGMPVYEIGGNFTEFTVTKGKFAIKYTASKTGIYELNMESDDLWCLGVECASGALRSHTVQGSLTPLVYLDEGESTYFTVWDRWSDMDSCKAKFKMLPASLVNLTPTTKTPADGEVIFTSTDFAGVGRIEIPVSGQYEIMTSCSQGGVVVLLDDEGKKVVEQSFNEDTKVIINKGTYYYYVEPYHTPIHTYTTTIKYYEIEEIDFGDEITTDTWNDKYAIIKLDKKSVVWLETKVGNVNVNAELSDYGYNISEYPIIMDAGEYLINYRTYMGTESTAVLRRMDIPTAVIGEEFTPCEADGYNNIILVAPETAEYEFYIPNSAQINDEYLSSPYTYISLKAGESVHIKYYGDEISVNKYVMEYKAVSGERDEVYINGGKKSGFVFTADADDIYNISLDDYYNGDAYFTDIKVFTDNKVIYEGKQENFADIELNLKVGDKIYFNVYNEYEANVYVNIAKVKITGNTIVDGSNPSWSYLTKKFVYVPEKEGYCVISTRKLSAGSAYAIVEINGEEVGYISQYDGNEVNKMMYVSPDEPISIKLTLGTGQTAQLALVFVDIQAKAIENMSDFEITDDSYYSFTLPEDGVYDISGYAYYGETSWRDEGVYPYFYSPIIKNYDYTSLSYDNYEGGGAVLFSGKKGDVVLFKEGPSEYYPAEYPISGKIEKVDTVPAPVGTLVESTEPFKVCALEVKTGGEYKFEDFSDELFDPNAGEWGMYYGRGYTVFGNGYGWYYPGMDATGNNILPEVISLEPGTYYVAMGTFDQDVDDEHIPAARFKLTKLSGDDEIADIIGNRTNDGVEYEIACQIPEGATLYAVLYAGTRVVEVKALKNPDAEGTILLNNNGNTNTCKLLLWDAEYEPICDSIVCE